MKQPNKDNIFSDYETAKMLNELGFNQSCIACYNYYKTFLIKEVEEYDKSMDEKFVNAPMWAQIKMWLWWNYKIMFVVKQAVGFKVFNCRVQEDFSREYIMEASKFESPILAEIDAIKKVVKCLHEKSNNKK